MSSLETFAEEKLRAAEARDLRRSLAVTRPIAGVHVERAGRRLVSFCSNDYLGLATDKRLGGAAVAAIETFGTGAGASRLVTGNHPLFETLEARLAAFKGCEDACVFGSGYLANIGVIPALAGRDDLIVLDELCHASMHAGARLAGGRSVHFAHNDVADCRRILERARAGHARALVLTEGVFSMDGDVAPLDALAALAEEFDAWLLVDDAHGFGVLGGGRGAAFEADPPVALALQVGTLSKAVGAYGGFVAASHAVTELIRNRARSLIYSTGLPPSVVASAIAALEIIAAEPERAARPRALARLFAEAAGLPAPDSHIVPIRLGAAGAALEASRRLEAEGFLITAIRPPTVPEGTARLRISFSAAHSEDEALALADAVVRAGLTPGPDAEKAAHGGLSCGLSGRPG